MSKIFLYSFILKLLLCSYTQSQTPRGADSASVKNESLVFFSYKITELPIEDALLFIANKSNIKIAFSKDVFPSGKKINLDIKNVSPEEAIEKIIKGTNTSLVAVSKDIYVIKTKEILKPTGSIRGLATDSTNGEALAFANVFIEGLNRGASTNNKGIFIITAVPPGEYIIVVSYVGYKPQKILAVVAEEKMTHIDFRLSPNTIEIQTVEKVGEKMPESNATDLGLERITVKDLEKIPQSVESDIFRSLQYIPGVKAAGDISARFYVRGSPSNQNLILLNSIPIYHPFHSLGMFSSIDPEMINNIEFYKGGYPVEYGGALSSITKLITKDGNKYNISAKAQASMLTGKASLEGPLGEGSFLITGRKSYNTDILKYFFDDKNLPINFYDMSLGLNFPNVFPNGNVKIFGYISNDILNNTDLREADFNWKNKLIGVNWFQLTESPMFVEVNFYYSKFEGEIEPNLSSVRPQNNSIDDITMDVNLR
ncbi:MAG: TonB-dependent receptor plug domain-containing protein, partial [Melioribacteraceae bacterium]